MLGSVTSNIPKLLKPLILLTLYLCSASLHCDVSAQENLSELLEKKNKASVPYMSVDDLLQSDSGLLVFDARALKEYDVSHIKNAIHIGYERFEIKKVDAMLKDKSQKIVVYCSVGIRSEDIAEKLKAAGYTNIYNLFGGIFEWKNKGFPVYNNNNQQTDSIHAYSKKWSQWLKKGIKVYD